MYMYMSYVYMYFNFSRGLTEGLSEYEPMDRWPPVYQGFDDRYFHLLPIIDIICAQHDR